MARPRKKENRDLPLRWRVKHGAYYYRVPLGEERFWDHKQDFRLGSTYDEAMLIFNRRLDNMSESLDFSNDQLMEKPELLSMSRPMENYALYFLFRGKELVYVGRSSSVFARLESHEGTKIYDRYAILPCRTEEEMQILEKRYIAKLKPIYNIYHINN